MSAESDLKKSALLIPSKVSASKPDPAPSLPACQTVLAFPPSTNTKPLEPLPIRKASELSSFTICR